MVLSLNDLAGILAVKKKVLPTVVMRLTKKGILQRLRPGLYGVYGKTVVPAEIAPQIYYPAYLSLKTVLAQEGIINQIPQQVYCVTLNKSYKTKISHTPIIYRQIRNHLFFGYTLRQGIPTAYPEKALLDLVYFVSRGRETVSLDELDLRRLNISRWNDFKKPYPNRMGGWVAVVESRF